MALRMDLLYRLSQTSEGVLYCFSPGLHPSSNLMEIRLPKEKLTQGVRCRYCKFPLFLIGEKEGLCPDCRVTPMRRWFPHEPLPQVLDAQSQAWARWQTAAFTMDASERWWWESPGLISLT